MLIFVFSGENCPRKRFLSPNEGKPLIPKNRYFAVFYNKYRKTDGSFLKSIEHCIVAENFSQNRQVQKNPFFPILTTVRTLVITYTNYYNPYNNIYNLLLW